MDLHTKETVASKNKKKISEQIQDFLYGDDKPEEAQEEEVQSGLGRALSMSTIVKSTRKMFLLQYALNVKVAEKTRLDATLKVEEEKVKKAEADLKEAEQSFDSFLQENDREAMEAQQRSLQAAIHQMKGEIHNLTDSFRKYTMYGKFLSAISPEEWRKEQEEIAEKNRQEVPEDLKDYLKLEADEYLTGDNFLYFKRPEQLLNLFSDLESENLSLIQKTQEADGQLVLERKESVRIRDELNQQAENLEGEIRQLEARIETEKRDTAAIDEKIESSGESKKGGEEKMLEDLEKQVLGIYEKCVGKNQAKISTIDMLHHIELKLESLTREQEHLNKEKVDIARIECEKERRHREREARLEAQRLMEASRNKAALDRALAPPYRPKGKRPVFRSRLPGKSERTSD